LHMNINKPKQHEMKKILMTLALVLASQLAYCQSITEVIDQLKALPGAESQVLGKDMVAMLVANIPDEATKNTMKKVEEMDMVQVSNASEEIRSKFTDIVKSLKNSYDKVAEETEGEETMFMFADNDDEGKPRHLMIGVVSSNDCQFICFKGQLSLADLEALGNMK